MATASKMILSAALLVEALFAIDVLTAENQASSPSLAYRGTVGVLGTVKDKFSYPAYSPIFQTSEQRRHNDEFWGSFNSDKLKKARVKLRNNFWLYSAVNVAVVCGLLLVWRRKKPPIDSVGDTR
jgi:hypothetical protein